MTPGPGIRLIAVLLGLGFLSASVALAAEDPCALPRTSGRLAAIGPALDLTLEDGTGLTLADVTLAAWPRELDVASRLASEALRSHLGEEIAYRAFGTPDVLGRRKAHVWAGEAWLQGDLAREGRVRIAPDKGPSCAEELLILEAVARREGRGIWREDKVRDAHDPDALRNATGTYQLVAGRVAAVARTRSGTYVNFGTRWRFDTTVLISPGLAETIGAETLDALEGRPVLVRGWIEDRNGPLIRLRSALQLRRVDE